MVERNVGDVWAALREFEAQHPQVAEVQLVVAITREAYLRALLANAPRVVTSVRSASPDEAE